MRQDQQHRLGTILSAFTAVLVLSCGSGEAVKDAANKSVPESARENNCQYAYDEGGDALWDLAKQEDVQSTYFEKEYQANHLNAVMTASGKQTASYIRAALGVPVYKTIGTKCDYFRELSTPPKDYQDIWDSASGGQASGSRLAGLYAGNQEKIINGKFLHNFVIMVADDSDRWTIVHEMMHHLFHRRDLQRGVFSNTATNEMKKAENVVVQMDKDFQADETQLKFSPLAVAVSRYTDSFIESMKRSSLEESTIEAMLGEAFVSQTFTFTPNGLRSSAWYLKSNAVKGYDEYEKVLKQVEVYANIAKSHEWADELGFLEEAKARLEKNMVLIQRLMLEADDRVDQSKSFLAHALMSFTNPMQREDEVVEVDVQSLKGCGHTHATDLAIQDSVNRISQLHE